MVGCGDQPLPEDLAVIDKGRLEVVEGRRYGAVDGAVGKVRRSVNELKIHRTQTGSWVIEQRVLVMQCDSPPSLPPASRDGQ